MHIRITVIVVALATTVFHGSVRSDEPVPYPPDLDAEMSSDSQDVVPLVETGPVDYEESLPARVAEASQKKRSAKAPQKKRPAKAAPKKRPAKAAPKKRPVKAAPKKRPEKAAPKERQKPKAAKGDSDATLPGGCCGGAVAVCDQGCGGVCGSGCQEDSCGSCNLGEPFKLWDKGDSWLSIGGWTQWGYHDKSTGMFNSRPNKVNNHQSWLYAEKAADGSNGLDWGFRADLMYGTDAAFTQAFGNNPGRYDFQNGFDHGIYGWAMPQLYAEFAKGDWSVIAGHFFTIAGHETVTAPDNFFYSHAYTMFYSEPFTHTGILATYAATDKLEVYGGWSLGWDTGFDQLGRGNNFLGGASYSLTEDMSLTYITTVGDFGFRGEGYMHSIVLDTKLTEDLNYVVQSDVLDTDFGDDHSVGLNQYLIYAISDCVGVGTRMEWWKYDGNSQYAWTVGFNVKPHANLIIRPEIRRDWNPGRDQNQTVLGVDAILTF